MRSAERLDQPEIDPRHLRPSRGPITISPSNAYHFLSCSAGSVQICCLCRLVVKNLSLARKGWIMLVAVLVVFGVVCVSLLLLSASCIGRSEIEQSTERLLESRENRFRVVAFNRRSRYPSGYYSIEIWDGGWKQVWGFMGYPSWKWNPVLEKYEAAKRLALSWKDADTYQAWVSDQYRRADEYDKNETDRVRRLYPVSHEEV